MKKMLLASLLTTLTPTLASAARFDCNKASTPNEKAICGDQALSQLDNDLAIYYKRALIASRDNGASLKNDQKAWLSGLKTCAQQSDTIRICLTAAYQDRIAFLKSAATAVAPASPEQMQRAHQDERARYIQEAEQDRQRRQAEWAERARQNEEESKALKEARAAEQAERVKYAEEQRIKQNREEEERTAHEEERKAKEEETARQLRIQLEAERERLAQVQREMEEARKVQQAEEQRRYEEKKHEEQLAFEQKKKEEQEREKYAKSPEGQLLSAYREYQFVQKCYEIRLGYRYIYVTEDQFTKMKKEAQDIEKKLVKDGSITDINGLWKRAAEELSGNLYYKSLELSDINSARDVCTGVLYAWNSRYEGLFGKKPPAKSF